jgi:hypothetical protein
VGRPAGRRLAALSVISVLVVSFSLVASFGLLQPVSAQTPQDLASKYAPVLHFTGGEKFYPTTVDYIITSSVLKQHSTGTVVDPAPTAATLGTHTSTDLYLDNKLGTGDAIAKDYASQASSIGYYAYVNVVTSGSGTVIQYWLFYAHNNGPLNDHQGDIEVVEVFLGPGGNPTTALYSQHLAGESAVWSDVETVGTHPVVYVAQGSHANYFRSYQGKIGIENDVVGSDGLTINPANLNLVMLTNQGWLNFQGRWGYWGTDAEVALGQAGPVGPVFNSGGVRWAQPASYLASTFTVNGTYFILAFIAANFLLIFLAYTAIRGAWKVVGIVRMQRKGGLFVGRFLRSRGSLGLILALVAVLITIGALALPWYSLSASSQSGPLAKAGGVNLLSIDGTNGLQVNMFMGDTSESTSGYRSVASTMIPFAIIIAAGLILLVLDIIGVKSGKKLGRKLIVGAVMSLIPFIVIYAFIAYLPNLLPLAAQLLPGQTIPAGVQTLVSSVASSPISGTASQTFDVVGATTVTWGFGIGAYLFVVAAVIRIVAALVMRGAPEMEAQPPVAPATPPAPVTATRIHSAEKNAAP